jgi:hypothetical protein
MKELEMSDVVGEYEFKDNSSIYSSIELKPDSTFYLRYEGGLLTSMSEGVCCVEKRQVVLNSFRKSHKSGFEIIENVNLPKDSIFLKVVDLYDNNLPFTKLSLVKGDSVIVLILGFDSEFKFLKKDCDSILIRSMFFPEIKIVVGDLVNNNLLLKFDQGMVRYEYLLDEKWLIKKNRLYSPLLKKNQF